ncbi:MAG: DEAD/DEAH box helicase [Rhizobacter sp.]|nr:DEAD/DEAH box helicase [Chlorobiales bacterium]
MAFHKLGLNDTLVQGILATGYTAPTDIQSKAIPVAVSGKDLIGRAQTGSGKTAAFVLPVLNRLSSPASVDGDAKPHKAGDGNTVLRALIVTPTRELASQVAESVKNYSRFMSVRSFCVYGGVDIQQQFKVLRRGVDILIATPGRLLDHINRGSIDLSHVEILVLDEADRMLDMGFIHDVKKIIAMMPAERQTLLFSATMPRELQTLASTVMKHPQMIEVGEQKNPATSITQHIYPVTQDLKMELLYHILKTEEMDKVLVFSRTKHGADRIMQRLERRGISAVALHSNRTQAQRSRALDGFKQGKFRVLVATDIAARGIDVDGISHVVNYDTPTYAEDYIHRIGRTGRASSTGDAITFVSNGEEQHMRNIERFIGKRLDRKKYEGFNYSARPVPESAIPDQSGELHNGSQSSGEGDDSKQAHHREKRQEHNQRRKTAGRDNNRQGDTRRDGGGRSNNRSERPYSKEGRPEGSFAPRSSSRPVKPVTSPVPPVNENQTVGTDEVQPLSSEIPLAYVLGDRYAKGKSQGRYGSKTGSAQGANRRQGQGRSNGTQGRSQGQVGGNRNGTRSEGRTGGNSRTRTEGSGGNRVQGGEQRSGNRNVRPDSRSGGNRERPNGGAKRPYTPSANSTPRRDSGNGGNTGNGLSAVPQRPKHKEITEQDWRKLIDVEGAAKNAFDGLKSIFKRPKKS